MKNLLGSLAAIAILTLATAAQAAPVDYAFSVSIDTQGTLYSNQTFDGSFSYDDSVASGTGPGGELLYELSGFSFTFDRVYGLGDLSYRDAAVAAGVFIGLDVGAANFAFLPAIGGGAPFFAFDFGAPNVGNGSIAYRRIGAVPEPWSAALVALALAGLASTRRRRP